MDMLDTNHTVVRSNCFRGSGRIVTGSAGSIAGAIVVGYDALATNVTVANNIVINSGLFVCLFVYLQKPTI
jgi:hypothetical protein